jgi:predicted alpha/beta-fold hydrolase
MYSPTSTSSLVAMLMLILLANKMAMGFSMTSTPQRSVALKSSISKSLSMYQPLPTTTTTISTASQHDVAAALDLKQMQEKHRPIASSFTPSTFNPHPIMTNCHLQTISGVFLRKNTNCAYITESGLGGITKVLTALSNIHPSEEICTFWDERQRISTPCGRDFYTVDIKYAGRRKMQFQSDQSKGMVILIHGLESNSNSSLSTDMATAYLQDGFDVTCINFRGCCGSPNDTLGGYHLGFTDDLRHFLKLMSEMWQSNANFDKRPIYLSGFSLGANVVVKCLGELGESAFSLYNVHGAAVCGAPFDAERNVKHLDAPGFNRAIYSANFLKTLKTRAQYQLDMFCNGDPETSSFDYNGVMSATSIAEFDDAFIAKVYGFEDNLDYYRRCSCYYYLPGVAVPLFIINAEDDPFFDP